MTTCLFNTPCSVRWYVAIIVVVVLVTQLTSNPMRVMAEHGINFMMMNAESTNSMATPLSPPHAPRILTINKTSVSDQWDELIDIGMDHQSKMDFWSVYVSLNIIGSLFCAMVIYSVWRLPTRISSDVLAGSLCFACLVMSASCGTQCMLNVINQHFAYGRQACYWEAVFHLASITNMFYVLLVMSYDSYRTIVKGESIGVRNALIAVGVTWLICALSVGLFSFDSTIFMPESGVFCFFKFDSSFMYGFFLPTFVIVVVAMSYFYYKIFQITRAALKTMSGHHLSITDNRRKLQLRLARKLFLFVLIFLMSWILVVVGIFCQLVFNDIFGLDAYGGVVGVLHSVIVPICYGIINPRLRTRMLNTMTCGCYTRIQVGSGSLIPRCPPSIHSANTRSNELSVMTRARAGSIGGGVGLTGMTASHSLVGADGGNKHRRSHSERTIPIGRLHVDSLKRVGNHMDSPLSTPFGSLQIPRLQPWAIGSERGSISMLKVSEMEELTNSAGDKHNETDHTDGLTIVTTTVDHDHNQLSSATKRPSTQDSTFLTQDSNPASPLSQASVSPFLLSFRSPLPPYPPNSSGSLILQHPSSQRLSNGGHSSPFKPSSRRTAEHSNVSVLKMLQAESPRTSVESGRRSVSTIEDDKRHQPRLLSVSSPPASPIPSIDDTPTTTSSLSAEPQVQSTNQI